MYALDTDTLTHYLKGTNAQITVRVEQCPPQDIYVPVAVVQEQIEGWLGYIDSLDYRKPQDSIKIPEAYALFRNALEDLRLFVVLDYTFEAEKILKNIRSHVKNLGVRDCRIAAIAMVNDFTVVTCNTKHFSRIPDLKFEDWSAVAPSDDDTYWNASETG